ncbi:DUF2797 domain-containing protein [Streptomyces sp. LD120]|uniref:DUF2797 domain-containing protein n=1 Tax=Streptomyces physcomitrii TaxID=2724184 RepID=A0ABX1H1Z8_9ACTN|nr:DUF2797 domain-containing protein [Streptomyces physcomitrii]
MRWREEGGGREGEDGENRRRLGEGEDGRRERDGGGRGQEQGEEERGQGAASGPAARPVLRWYGQERGERGSVLTLGDRLAFRAVGERRCTGVWRGGRVTPCPGAREVPGTATRAQCPECAALDRAHSVAADTFAEDPRPYRVYLAWFGPGMLKTGITGAARGAARLLEQGAVAFSWLGTGPLMAARRTEELLRTALGVPDRIPYAAKRTVRTALPPPADRAAGIAALHARARALPGWPESLAPLPCEVVDHGGVFGLDGPGPPGRVTGPSRAATGPSWVVTSLAPEATVAGRLLAAAGPDLHLAEPGTAAGGGGRLLVVDGRLLAGWRLLAAEGAERATAPVRPLPGSPAAVQGGLF